MAYETKISKILCSSESLTVPLLPQHDRRMVTQWDTGLDERQPAPCLTATQLVVSDGRQKAKAWEGGAIPPCSDLRGVSTFSSGAYGWRLISLNTKNLI